MLQTTPTQTKALSPLPLPTPRLLIPQPMLRLLVTLEVQVCQQGGDAADVSQPRNRSSMFLLPLSRTLSVQEVLRRVEREFRETRHKQIRCE